MVVATATQALAKDVAFLNYDFLK